MRRQRGALRHWPGGRGEKGGKGKLGFWLVDANFWAHRVDAGAESNKNPKGETPEPRLFRNQELPHQVERGVVQEIGK